MSGLRQLAQAYRDRTYVRPPVTSETEPLGGLKTKIWLKSCFGNRNPIVRGVSLYQWRLRGSGPQVRFMYDSPSTVAARLWGHSIWAFDNGLQRLWVSDGGWPTRTTMSWLNVLLGRNSVYRRVGRLWLHSSRLEDYELTSSRILDTNLEILLSGVSVTDFMTRNYTT